jgi:hypothetical protein
MMGVRKLLITAAVILAFMITFDSLSGTLDAMGWPSQEAVLIRNFGSNDRGNPVLGMIFEGGSEVLAAEKGEVIFSRNRNDAASRLPSPLGAWVAVDHGDGLISIYSRFAEAESVGHTTVEKQQTIASSGVSGWSSRNGFYFIVFDRRERRWVNPAMIITPVRETGRPPQILSVNLRNAQGQVVQSPILSQGRYTVLVNAAGASAWGTQQYAPQRIVCSVNGAEVGSINFEAVSARDGVLLISRNGLVPARQVYSAYPSFETAEVFLTRGLVTLEVIVQDITGNPRSLVNRLTVN